jgi:hypothetical protein
MYVRYECDGCDWKHDVPSDKLVTVNGRPMSTYVPFHMCPNGGTTIERAGFECEVYTKHPAQHVRIKL